MSTEKSLAKIFICVTVLLLLAGVYYFVDAGNSPVFPRCIFNLLTGFYCPGCGSQRAFSAILHGDLWQAINYNILFVLWLPLLFYSAGITVLNILRKQQLVQQLFYSAMFVKILLGTVVVFWITRNLPFYPFNLLAPHVVH